MHKKLRKLLASTLIFSQFFQIAFAALPAANTQTPAPMLSSQDLSRSLPQNLALTSNQFGISGPLNLGINYSNLTGTYFNGQFLKLLSDKLGFNILGEYGDKQYRINGTLGFFVAAQTFFKISAEQLGQQLPFFFSTGNVEKRVKQNAIGARFLQHFDHSFFDNLSIGYYAARAPNVGLDPVTFISNGSNCQGFSAGLTCMTERHIAGASSTGGDFGLAAFLTPKTWMEGKLYYDAVHYNTVFQGPSKYNASGYGGGISAEHLLADNLKLSAGAEIRKIYNTFNLALSWMPPLSNASGTELALVAQKVVSHSQIPDDDTIGLRVTFLADRVNYQTPVYALNKAPLVNSIASWISQPAVKMNQVLAISEEYTHLAATAISGVAPAFGPLVGGNIVVITGINFLSGAMVQIGGKIATITSSSPSSISIIVPPGSQLGGVPVSIITPDGRATTIENGYLYTNGAVPVLNGASPAFGPVSGGTSVTVSGANFIPGETLVSINGTIIPASQVLVNSPISLTFVAPPHLEGSVIITVITPAGVSNPVPGGYTYAAEPGATILAPNIGSIAGGTQVFVTGTNFATGNTWINIGGMVMPASSVTVHSSTSLSFNTPAHAAGNVDVTVATAGGTSNPIPGGFTYDLQAPTLTGIQPAVGSSAGSDIVTLSGSNFVSGNTSVTIGGIVIPAGSVTVVTPSSLTFSTPAHAAGDVTVSVTVPVGSSNNMPGGFTYVDAPQVFSLSPAAGPLSGGTTVVIHGTGFVPDNTSVTIGGMVVLAPDVVVTSSTTLSFVTPAHAAGNAQVTVTAPGGTSGPVPGGFNYENAPTATLLTPASGPAAGGTAVTVTGTNFDASTVKVTIGGVDVAVSNVTPTSLNFNTPAHAGGNVAVSVVTSGGTSNSVPGGFTYIDTPTATSLSPAFGPATGGTVVTVNGNNFVQDINTKVTIDGMDVAATVTSTSSLTFITPLHAAGNVAVTVTTSGGVTAPVQGGFTYENVPSATSLNPDFGPGAGGTDVIVTGSNFVPGDPANKVTIGGIDVPVFNVSSTSLTFTTPLHALGNVAVTVTTSAGTSSAVPGGFTYLDAPTATSLSPTFGPAAGDTEVTISGSNFALGTTVTIGGITVAAIDNSSTSLTFRTPAHAPGTVAVTVTTPAGTSSAVPGGFTYEAAPTVTSLAPAFGPIAGGTVVTVNGSNFNANTIKVTIGGADVVASNVTPTSLTFTTPAHVAGNVAVMVVTSGGTSSPVPGGYTYMDTPAAAFLNPAFGTSAGGTTVTVTGSNFDPLDPDTKVTIDGVDVSANVISATTLTFTTPTHAAANVAVTVTTSGGTSAAIPSGFTYVDAPGATSLSPAYGTSAGGTLITVSGSNFDPLDPNIKVAIGGIDASVSNVTPASLTFTTPAHVGGNVAVTVTTSGGTSAAVPSGFTYVDPPLTTSLSPTAGPLSGNTTVVVTGSNFVVGDPNASVTIDGNIVAATVNSATSLTFVTPSALLAGNVAVLVTTSGGTSNVPGGFTYNDSAPAVVSLTPTTGSVGGGTAVTITGTNFVAGNTSVNIDGVVIAATVNSAISLTFVTLPHAFGNVPVFVTTPAGNSGLVPGGFTFEAAPTATALAPTAGPIAGGTLVTVTGTNFVPGDTSVTIGANTVAATVDSATSLTFTTPAVLVAGNVSVTVANSQGNSMPVPGGFTYNDTAATVTSLTPNAGPVGGGTVVTITGTNFVPGNTSVNIDGALVPATVNSSTSLTFVTPVHIAGNVAVFVTTPVGNSALVPGGFIYQEAPVTATLSPAAGPVAGNTSVTITGTGFIPGNTTVTIGGNTVSANASSATSLSFLTPAHAAGNVAVTVSTAGGTSNAVPGGFTYQDIPAATSLSPAFGPVGGNTLVTITGSNFVPGNTSVTLGGTQIIANVTSSTSLTFTTLAHAAGNVAVTVTTGGGTSSAVPGGFTFVASPAVTSLTPTEGPVAGNTSVTISGSNFVVGDTNATVTIGGNTVPATVNSSTSLSFTTPVHAAGNVAVTVTTSGGISGAVPGGFTYRSLPTAASLAPAFGPVAGNTLVTVTGTNFVPGNTFVTVDGIQIVANAASTTSLTFTTLAHAAGNVAVTVTTAGGSSTAVPGGFTFAGSPAVTSLTPTEGPVAGNTSVTISGSNFVVGDTNATVTIGGNTVPATVNSSTSLSFTTPAHAAGNVVVTVTTSGGISGAVPGGFTYRSLPTAASLAPAFGPVAGNTLVTVTGTNFVPGNTFVTVDGTQLVANASSATSLTFTTLPHVAGNVAVTVTTGGGTSAAIPGGFTYVGSPAVTSLTPNAGPVAGGTSVTISGSNFAVGDTNTTVTIGGNTVSATVNSSTSLSFTTPAHAAGNVAVTVSTSGGASGAVPGGFTYRVAPTATSLTPTSGTTAGGTTVTITGSNFVSGDTSVSIGGNTVLPGNVNVTSPTSLNFGTPEHAAGNVGVSVSTAGGTTNNISGGYTYLAPVLSSCSAAIPNILGIQLVTCVGANVTLFQTTFLKVSGGAACSTFPVQQVAPTVNIFGQVLIVATNIPIVQNLIGCNIQLCSNNSCTILGGTTAPVLVAGL